MIAPSVQIRVEGGVIVAEFWDSLRLDPWPVRELREAYESTVNGGEGPNLLVDMTGISFAGSAALSGFVLLQKLCRKLGGRLIFCEVEPTVLESFRASRLIALFQFISSKADGLATLADPAGPITPSAAMVAVRDEIGAGPLARRRASRRD